MQAAHQSSGWIPFLCVHVFSRHADNYLPIPTMGGWFSSSKDGPPSSTVQTNVSVTEDRDGSIRLTYTVGSTHGSSCSFQWEERNGGYVGVMNAWDGNTLYTHTFPRVVPDYIKESLKGPSKEKIGNRVIFTFKRSDTSFSLQDYVRN